MNERAQDVGVLLLRVSFSISLLVLHGLEKWSMVISGTHEFPDPLGVGPLVTLLWLVLAECVSPVLILMGFKVKYATIPILIAMAVAFLIFHAPDGFAERELAYVYFFAYAAIGLLGPGRYSLDHYLNVKSGQ